jgi:hypothetical protein
MLEPAALQATTARIAVHSGVLGFVLASAQSGLHARRSDYLLHAAVETLPCADR